MNCRKWIAKGLLIPAALLACAWSWPWEDDEITLVKDGVPMMDIVVDENALEPAKDAAADLQKYVRKITGAELPIVHKTDRKAIFIGETAYAKTLGLLNQNFEDQEYLIKTDKGNLILTGKDESDADNAKLRGRSFNWNKYFQKTGSVYAVDDFLEKFCGVRWYMPTELGEVVPETKTLSVKNDIYIRRKPSVKFRSLFAYWQLPEELYVIKYAKLDEPPAKRVPDDVLISWGRHVKLGGTAFCTNHSSMFIQSRFKHIPRWFANHDTETGGNQLCYSQEDLVMQVAQDARDFYDGKLPVEYAATSVGDYFSVMPNDTDSWCNCEKCKAQYDEKKPTDTFHNGSRSRYVWTFVSKVAREVAKTHPGKKIGCCAYWDYRECPDDVDIPDNVAVFLTKDYGSFYDENTQKKAWDEIKKWREKVPEVFIWDYYLFPWIEGFPNLSPWTAAKEIYTMRENNINCGLMCQLDEYYWRNPAKDHLRVYVSMKLLDDWNANVNEITDEYFRLFYGPAEKPMREYWELLDKIYMRKSITDNSETLWTKVCSESDIQKLSNLLNEAEALCKKDSVYAKRVQLMRNAIQGLIESNAKKALDLIRNRKSVEAVKVPHAPKLDGTLDDPLWQKAPDAENWLEQEGGGPVFYDTRAKVLYDDQNLYIGFSCTDAVDYKLDQACRVRDGQAYVDDSVEAFLAPNGKEYYHIVSNTVPCIFDQAKIEGLNDAKSWDSHTESYVSLKPGLWTLVLKIPLSDLTDKPIVPGTEWRVNFCRNRRNLPGFRCKFFSWSAPGGYHNVERFGILKFK